MSTGKMTPYYSPVDSSNFSSLTISLCGTGLLLLAHFTVQQVNSSKYSRNLFNEVLIALLASVFLGFGAVFLLLWVGIYV